VGGDVVGHDMVGRVEYAVVVSHEVELMVDDQERPARGNGTAQQADRGRLGIRGQDAVLDRHEVEGAQLARRLDQPAVHPCDRELQRGGSSRGASEGHCRRVEGRDRPSSLCEPDRVGSFATPNVERLARFEVGDLGDEWPFGWPDHNGASSPFVT
jgi:hypothetical protein